MASRLTEHQASRPDMRCRGISKIRISAVQRVEHPSLRQDMRCSSIYKIRISVVQLAEHPGLRRGTACRRNRVGPPGKSAPVCLRFWNPALVLTLHQQITKRHGPCVEYFCG